MLVQVVGGKVVNRSEGIGHGNNRVGDGQRLGRNSHRRRSGRTDRRGGHEVGREGVLGIVHEVLDELEVLGLELLAGSLETVDFLELGLLLGQSLADNLAGLGVSLITDTLSVLVGIVDDGLSGLLGSDQGSGNLALLSGEVRGGSSHGGGRNGLGGGILSLGKLSLRIGKLLLGSSQTTLKVDDLSEHSVNLGGQRLQEDVDLSRIVASLGLRESLSLDVCRGNSHNKSPFSSPRRYTPDVSY